MEEREYREIYSAINERRCPYEKAINSRRCNCSQSRRFNLANREGVACKSEAGNLLCNDLLNIMRQKARFSLHVTHATSPLPHAKEIKVQVGGLLGLQKLLNPQAASASTVGDIYGLANEDDLGKTDTDTLQIVAEAPAEIGRTGPGILSLTAPA